MYNRTLYICLATVFTLLLGLVQVGYGQEYATWTPSSGTINVGLGLGNGGVTNPGNARTETTATHAVMMADRLQILLVSLGTDAYLQLKFPPESLPSPGATTYVKISKPTLTGLNLDLAQLLGLAGTNIVGEVWTGAGNNQDQRGTKIDVETITTIIVDQDNNYFLAVTPKENVSYNSVNIKLLYPSGLVNLGSLTMNVYHAFTLSESPCNSNAVFSNLGEAQGINLDLLGLSELIANPHHAINEQANQYSSFSSGVLSVGVANTVSQTVYFDHVTSVDDGIRVRLGLSSSLIGLDVAERNAVNFVAYKGEEEVWSENLYDLATLLGLDLLNLISLGANHDEVNMVFKPGVAFDRVKIEFNAGLVGLGVLGDALRVYNISLAPAVPEIIESGQPEDVSICEGEHAEFTVTATSSGESPLSYQWQYFNGIDWIDLSGATSDKLTLSSVPLNENGKRYRVRVTGGNEECLQTIYSNEAILVVNVAPGKPHLTISDIIN